ncbi:MULTISPECIES: TonB-dependent receptor [unclassified Novosphingobium]|uniref:TonB-dependent receptor n=1 Tax=unclassified Novosphingobium TaxID=2644732 RepID=UPI000EEB024C|nr:MULTISPECIES: TonB-dependent receptor [unclassified Novosphingobium]HCF25117.1 TonB-dependent receptor [Novosphingobium sp.]HQV02263.1 TonB-dependent receptor [Novosphingobium sp.]
MKAIRRPVLDRMMLGASALALGVAAQPAVAQEVAAADDSEAEIVVTGIRASLRSSMDTKRSSIGVVDAISAEDIGKFPDTNLAESLQRITGVSIDRNSGEGSKVTVRGFGPDFNLVLLNGRQMPASGLGSCCEAPASRSFDFANLAAEGVAGVEIYKSGRASLPTGGIGSVINIKTPRPLDRPGFQGSIGVKGVYDHTFEGTNITPEVSGILSQTFYDDKIGILVTGSYQKRKASLAQFNAGWREGYLGNENNWGSLPVDANDWRGNFAQTQNRPNATTVYQVTQNAGYDFTDIERERINGQVVLQFKPTETLSAVIDYTYSQNTIDARTNSIGVWFNHNQTSSSWTNGPAAGPNFYAEAFGPGEGKDLAITGAVAKNRSINKSLGGNLSWKGDSGLHFELDGHHSTAESKPNSPYGSNIAVGSAIFGVQNQRVDFTSDMPVISVTMYPSAALTASNIRPAGNAFRNAYMKDEINEVSMRGGYDFNDGLIDSLDFGVTYTENKVRSAYGFLQSDSWGGTLSAAATPDSLYTLTGLPDRLAGMSGSNANGIIPNYFQIDTVGLITLLESQIGVCSNSWVGDAIPGTCLAEFTADRRIQEKTIAPYIQTTHSFDLGAGEAHLRLGLRYEDTIISSSAGTGIPTGTSWTADNEIGLIFGGGQLAESTKGHYQNWLPAIDLDISPIDNVKLRASYSHTITRPDYGRMQGGITINQPLRPNGGSTAASGNPGLLPYKSKNIDASAEWYYGRDSYISVGYFNKGVENFIANSTVQQPFFDLTNPAQGAAVAAARTALGGNPGHAQILAWLAVNNPSVVEFIGGVPRGILGQPGDPAVIFTYDRPINSTQTARLQGWEFAIQHSFWDTGFGAILNYTIVKSDTKYDNAQRYTVTQFAVNGASDSANAVLYYDKNGIQFRVAYNWRDEFLSGYGLDPYYINPYGQFDVSASWEFRKGMTVFAEGINVTNADRSGHMRNDQTVFFAAPGYARYAAGLRVNF